MKIEYLAVVAAAQFLLFVMLSFFSRDEMPKSGLRSSERNLLVSAVIAFFAFVGLTAGTSSSSATQAAAVAASHPTNGSCASVESGDTASDVKRKVGKPDEIRDDAEIRGPGAKTWIYRGSRCAVHIIEEKVEFVE